MNVVIMYYDSDTSKETMKCCADTVVDTLEDVKVLVLPKKFDLLLDCSLDQLVHVRSVIDTALSLKFKELQEPAVSLPSVQQTEIDRGDCDKIVDITKYLS